MPQAPHHVYESSLKPQKKTWAFLEKYQYAIPYIRNLKRNDTNELIYKIKTDLQTLRRNLWLPGGKDGEKG